MHAPHLIDGYKADHRRQYTPGTQLVFSNLTARSSRIPGVDRVLFVGLQAFLEKYLVSEWRNFFLEDKATAVARYKRRMDHYLGAGAIDMIHIEALHDLGYLPVEIWALPEGSLVPLRVPMLVLWNTHPDFFWVTNYLETLLSCMLWGPITSGTTALRYRRVLEEAAERTGGDPAFVPFQAHDFSMRGMFGVEAAEMSGAAHLMAGFVGTDSIPAIDFLEKYYGANAEKEVVGLSVPATEHSVMCLSGEDDELGTFTRLITEAYPHGIVSVVSDSWDFWRVVTEYLPALKDIIMTRDGKLVIRPDSGDPVDILCGYDGIDQVETPEEKGLIQCLWDIFGGTVNEKGFKQLDPHIGAIYGDSITVERAQSICAGLQAKGFASTNVVFGVGSYTYQYVTRDTFGMAMKATFGVVNGEERNIFKKPKTDNGSKHSAKGLLAVFKDEANGSFFLEQETDWDRVRNCAFRQVFANGEMFNRTTLAEVRERVNNVLK